MVVTDNFLAVIQNEYIRALLVLVLAIAVAQLFLYFTRHVLTVLAKKTSTKLDDILIDMITMPVYYILLFAGLYFGLRSLSFIAEFNGLIDQIFVVLLILLIAVILARITDTFVNHWLHIRSKKAPKLINKVINLAIYLVALLTILQFFKIAITPLLATLGLGALALGLALQPTLANLFAGIRILSDQPINVGDYVEIDNLKGYVEDIGWHTTRIRTLPSNIVVVPNSKLADSVIVNNSLPNSDLGVVIKCGVDYRSNLKKVEKVTMEVANKLQKKHPSAVHDFKPFMRYEEFGESNINFFIILRAVDYFNKYNLTHEFIKELKTRYDKEKIEISWPIRKVYNFK